MANCSSIRRAESILAARPICASVAVDGEKTLSNTPVVTENADSLDGVLMVAGTDMHKFTHYVAIMDGVGRDVTHRQFDAIKVGHAELVRFPRSHLAPDRVGGEGTGSRGAGIARALPAQASQYGRRLGSGCRRHAGCDGPSC